jgi:hypothetical protein
VTEQVTPPEDVTTRLDPGAAAAGPASASAVEPPTVALSPVEPPTVPLSPVSSPAVEPPTVSLSPVSPPTVSLSPVEPSRVSLSPVFPPAVEPPTVALSAVDLRAAESAGGLAGAVEASPAWAPGGEPAAAGQPPPEAGPRRNRSRLVKLVTVGAIGLAVALALSAYAVIQYVSGGVDNAKVGACIAGASAPKEGQEAEAGKAKVVDCGSAGASFKVVARFEKKKLSEADAACRTHPEAPFVFTAIPNGGTGVVLCLAKL